jgi:polar amino acid transport system substrate-binding protein
MKRILSLVICIIIAIVLVFPACADTPQEITVATNASSRPFEFVNIQTDKIEGFDIDLLNAIATKEGLKVKYVDIQFDSILDGVAACEYDAAISSITITPERSEKMLFSEPYFTAGQIIVVKKANTDIVNKNSLNGKDVGVLAGTTGSEEAAKISGINVKEYDEISFAYNDLIKGTIDAVIYDNSLAQFYINTNPGVLKTVGNLMTEENYGIAVCKDNKKLLDKINSGLKKVREEGIIDSLIKKWIGG